MGKVFASKFVGTGLSSYEKRIYRGAVSQRLRDIGLEYTNHSCTAQRLLDLHTQFHSSNTPS